MIRICALLSTGIAVFRTAVESNDTAARRQASESLQPRGLGARIQLKIRVLSFPILFLGVLAALWGTTAAAQSHTIYLLPSFVYNDGNIPTPYETTLPAAWSDVQGARDYCTDGTCYTVQNLHPAGVGVGDGPIQFDGVPYQQFYDVQSCNNGSCTTNANQGDIQTGIVCPDGSGAGYYNSPAMNRLIACAVTIYDVQPPPKNCESCIGNPPIYAATGQKMQVETDYSGATGLDFTRAYRSNNGFFASVLTQTFVNNSLPAGTTSSQCYPAQWTYSSASGSSCFPYISVYPNVNGGVAQYQLQTDDGRSIQFTGPNNAVTQAADINERVTMLTVSGATEWQVKREDDSTEVYSAAGSLIQKTLRGGRTFTYTYSTASTPANIAPSPGLLLTQSDAFGHTLSWQYNASGQMTQLTDPAGGGYQYSYTNGNLTGVIYPDESSKTFWYNESANTGGANLPTALTGITDENGVRYATFQFNSTGLAVNTQHAGGVESYSINYPYTAYTGQNYSATVTDPLGTVRTYHFSEDDLSYNLDTGQTQPAASGTGTVTQSESYDANGNLAWLSDYNGNVTHYVYDLTRNLETSRTEAYGTAQARTITTVWDANWRQPDLITDPNRTTAFTYDSMGNALTKTVTDTTVTPNVARTWTYTYDSYGRMLTAQGPRTDVNSTTTYTYYTCTTGYQCGEVQTITDAVAHVTTFNTYNAHGQPLTITDPNGVVTTLTYDARMRLTSRQVGTETTSYSYYPTGLLDLVTLPDGSTVQYTYDAAHRLTDITDGLGNHIHYTLDNMGNRTAENTYDPSSTLRRTHTRVINALNQLYQDVNAAGTSAVTTTYGYDNDGNQTSIAAPLSRNTANQYDALNRLTQITDPNSGVTQLGYDANDNLASVKDPRSLTTSYSHNGFGDVSQQVSPDTGTSTNTYDSGGNLKTATDARSAVATYAYDALNRVTQVAYSDQTINFTYDAGTNGVGRLTGASDANHTLAWTYDPLGRVIGKGQTVGTITKSVGYAYTNGDLVTLVTPSGQTISYGYTNHQITSVAVNGTTIVTGVTYFPFGPVSGWTWGNTTAVSRTYDTDAKITQISTAGDAVNFGYDNAFRITGITDTGNSANTWTLGYDSLDRLTSAAEAGTTLGWTYDANGNRLSQTGSNASTFTPSTTSNQLNTITGGLTRTYGYDAAGNTTVYASDSFTLNQRGRVSVASLPGGAADYIYNALGQMVQKSGNGGTTLLMYDEAGHLLGEYSSTGALVEETVWMGDVPVAALQPNGTGINIYYVHTDQLNAPRVITRASDNAIAWRWDTDPFGTVTPNQNPSGLGSFAYNLRFPGQYYLPESGLNLNYFRDYDPQTGRYVESDPIGLRGGISTYAYVKGNPINQFDPVGLILRIVGSTPANQAALEGAVATLERTFLGGGLVQMVENSPYVYELTDIYSDQNQAGYFDRVDPFLININPDFHPLIHVATPCGQEPAATVIILAHELGHVAGTYDVGPGKMDTVNQFENPVRQELGYPLRTAYPTVRRSEARNCSCNQ
jgi:RHS repeat-associated protein